VKEHVPVLVTKIGAGPLVFCFWNLQNRLQILLPVPLFLKSLLRRVGAGELAARSHRSYGNR